eukprot:gnl/Chilomastix_caulleri/1024.p2 GENE.gnl/Chilomastix_caulleri/1024~~gnl/Chilomastix_caulleri/1024.p2  ORF type:complete len:76 (+),score=6.63 gnl/Chilomastix_caulleri/1024:14-241(+)
MDSEKADTLPLISQVAKSLESSPFDIDEFLHKFMPSSELRETLGIVLKDVEQDIIKKADAEGIEVLKICKKYIRV